MSRSAVTRRDWIKGSLGPMAILLTGCGGGAGDPEPQSSAPDGSASRPALTLTGPVAGVLGVRAEGFRVELLIPVGTTAGSVTVVPSDSGAGGSFAPSSLTLSDSATSVSFSYVPGSVGRFDIRLANDGTLPEPRPLSFSSTATLPEWFVLGFDGKTPEQISIHCPVSRKPADGTWVQVHFRRDGALDWVLAHPLMHIIPGYVTSGAPQPVLEAFAGAIFDLEAGIAYEVRCTVYEPGQPTAVFSALHSTRALPGTAPAATRSVSPGADLQHTLDGLRPGDVLELASGTYLVNRLQVNCSGTAEQPIYIRCAARGGAVLHAAAGIVVQFLQASNVVLENITIRGSGTDSGTDASSIGVAFHEPSGPQLNVTLRHNTVYGVDQGVVCYDAESVLAYDNDLQGNNPWHLAYAVQPGDTLPRLTWNDDGICLAGRGNAAWNNTLNGFGDAFSVRDGTLSAAIYFWRNRVAMTGDDAFEGDYGTRNLGFYDNHVTNCGTLFSADPVWGGPCFVFRNVAINTIRGPYKLNDTNAGCLIYNNTVLRSEGLTNFSWVQYNNGVQSNWAYRNNLIIDRSASTTHTLMFEAGLGGRMDFDHNAWWPSRAFQWSGTGGHFASLAAAQAGLPQTTPLYGEANARHTADVIAASNPWVASISLGSDHTTLFSGTPELRLLDSSLARGAGVHIPGITDGHGGTRPDMGAHVGAEPSPLWQPARSHTIVRFEPEAHRCQGLGRIGRSSSRTGPRRLLDWTHQTNVQAITDTSNVQHQPAGQALAWLESLPRYFLTNWPGSLTWDAAGKRLLVAGAAQSLSSESPAGAHSAVVRLAVDTGRFSKQWNPVGQNLSHCYDSNATRPLHGFIYRRDYASGQFWKMDLATDAWSPAGNLVTLGMSAQVPALEVHPGLGAKGSVLLCGQEGRLGRFDVDSGVVSLLASSHAGVLDLCPVMSYHAAIDAVVFGGGRGGTALYTIDSAGSIRLLSNVLPPGVRAIAPDYGVVLAPDPQGRAVAWLFDPDMLGSRRLWRLDLRSGVWADAGALPVLFGATQSACIGCVPEAGVLVAFDGNGREDSGLSQSRVWLFKPA